MGSNSFQVLGTCFAFFDAARTNHKAIKHICFFVILFILFILILTRFTRILQNENVQKCFLILIDINVRVLCFLFWEKRVELPYEHDGLIFYLCVCSIISLVKEGPLLVDGWAEVIENLKDGEKLVTRALHAEMKNCHISRYITRWSSIDDIMLLIYFLTCHFMHLLFMFSSTFTILSFFVH